MGSETLISVRDLFFVKDIVVLQQVESQKEIQGLCHRDMCLLSKIL